MRQYFIAAFMSAALFSNALPAQADPNYGGVNAAIAAAAQHDNAPGLQFAIERDGTVVDLDAVGYADVGAKTKVTSANIFALADCSMPFTAMAIMQLVDAGKLELSTPAFPYLGLRPAHDADISQITIQQLLNHSSGLPRSITDETAFTLAVAQKAAAVNHLLFRPGTRVAYSDAGYDVLGAVIQKASGQDYQDYVIAHIFTPAGAADDVGYLGNMDLPHMALGYAHGQVAENARRGSSTPSGGWAMSATDAARILAAYDAGKLVSPASRKAMLTPQNVALGKNSLGGYYGLGWDLVAFENGGYFYAKNGDMAGFGAWFEHRTDGTVFVVLRNSQTGMSTHPNGLAAVEAAFDRVRRT
jgi:CubicO group peptidase (beta-lactamase class C family)